MASFADVQCCIYADLSPLVGGSEKVQTYVMKPEVAASDICIYLNQMIDVRLKRECMLVLFIILTARVNGQMIRLVLCC